MTAVCGDAETLRMLAEREGGLRVGLAEGLCLRWGLEGRSSKDVSRNIECAGRVVLLEFLREEFLYAFDDVGLIEEAHFTLCGMYIYVNVLWLYLK